MFNATSFSSASRGTEAKPYYLSVWNNTKHGGGWRTDTVTGDRAYVIHRRDELIRQGRPARVETHDRQRLYN